MRRINLLVVLLLLGVAGALRAADPPALPFEQQLAEATKSEKVTVIHLWAPWCPNCRAELANGGWSRFIAEHPDCQFIFVTVWNAADGHEILEANGLGSQKNFQLRMHPNASRKKGEKLTELLGLPVSWIPSTWVFRDGKLRYALNYGELHFPVLSQLIADSTEKWDR